MRGADRPAPEIPVGTQVRLREDALDGYIREARLKMDRGRIGEVVAGGTYKGDVRVLFPAVGRRKEYRQDLRVRELEVVAPEAVPSRPAPKP